MQFSSSRIRLGLTLAFLPLALAAVPAQSVGPDVIVGDLSDMGNYGSSGTIAAFSIGTTSCNIGTQTLNWQSSTQNHPVIGQNLYRIKNGRCEQIGLSWLKHGFTALAQSLCATCQNPGTGTLLGVNCSDPYVASLNGSQGGLGPRFEVNASTGIFPYPFTSPSFTGNIARRLQVQHADLAAASNPGAIYICEAQYIANDDAAAGNDNNNTSYRRCNVAPNGGSYNISLTNATVRQKTAVEGWYDLDSTVTITPWSIVNDGRFIVGSKVNTSTTPGFSRYTYAVENQNSYRSAGSFTINFPNGTSVQNPYFHDVFYHSGEPQNGTDWTYTAAANGVVWQCTETFAQNANANAIRWGTCYTFEVEANAAPTGWSIAPFAPQPCPPIPPIPPSGSYTLATNQAYDFTPVASLTNVGNGPTSDDSNVLATLPFPFPFYGQTLTQVRVSSNGYLCVPSTDGNNFTNVGIPNAATPNGFIAGYWDDLNPNGAQLIRYGTAGVAPNRKFVVDYAAVPYYSGTGTNSFQIILVEADQSIKTTIVSCTQGGSSATRGVEAPNGTSGTQRSLNQAGSAPANSTDVYTPNTGTILYAATLTQIGNGAPGTVFGFNFAANANAPYLLALDTAVVPIGPTTQILALTPGILPIRDGIGVWFFNPLDVTDACGLSESAIVVPPGGLSFLNAYWAQAMSLDILAPAGIRLSPPVDINGLP